MLCQKRGELTHIFLAILALMTIGVLGIVLNDAPLQKESITGLTIQESEQSPIETPFMKIAPFVFGLLIFVILGVASVSEKKQEQKIREVQEYTKNARSIGFSDNEISTRLQDAGWDEKVIGKIIRK